MANLVSPGVSVTITDESFFIPTAAPTVPLLFVATGDQKKQADGVSDALGTFESNVIRTVTSLEQSLELYGVPVFKEDSNGNQFHGDSRNEYGLFALNQFLGVGNRSFVIRANVNLDDDIDSIREVWDRNITEAAYVLENALSLYLAENNAGLAPSDPEYKLTVDKTKLLQAIGQVMEPIYEQYSFSSDDFKTDFEGPHSPSLDIYGNGYDQPPTGEDPNGFRGYVGAADDWESNGDGSVVPSEWTPSEAANFFTQQADEYKYTLEFFNNTRLGENDEQRRENIVEALQSSINQNEDIRSETFEYNLILTPGYYECVDEMLLLSNDMQDEAFVIGDTPMWIGSNQSAATPEATVNWASSTERQTSTNVAYYYPFTLQSNLDGVNVMAAASGTALRTYAYSDDISELWFAPAGTRRGLISGITNLGYAEGVPGTPTLFVGVALNQGQRDDMYKYFTNLNPMVFFPSRGFLVWGQKTSAPDASALDRVNVVRLVMYMKRQLRKNTLSYVFEPNDQLTRDSIKALVDSFLGDLVVKRGLYDYATVCDETNNTPDRIDRNELYVDVAIKPVKAAEFIYIPVRIVATGAEI